MHKKGIIHCDVGCHNAILVRHDRLKIIDFEGCSIDGATATSCYEWFSYRRSMPSTSKQADIFAYGYMVYEVITGRLPHEELAAHEDRTALVERRYNEDEFPNIENLPRGDFILGCWHGTISSMSMGEVIRILHAAMLSYSKVQVVGLLPDRWEGRMSLCFKAFN